MQDSLIAAIHHLLRRNVVGLFVLVTVVSGGLSASGQGDQSPLVPDAFDLSDAVSAAISADWLTDDERRELRVFHGVWDEDRDLVDPASRARVALNAWRLDSDVFDNPVVPVELRAEALLRRGDVERVIELLLDVDSIHAQRVIADAFEVAGEDERASDAVDEPVRALLAERFEHAGPLVDGVRALMVRSRIEGQPARDFQTMMNLLGRARTELDRLYWPASLVEAQLLRRKHATGEAITALYDTLRLNPRCAEAWYELGLIAIDRFDFDSASAAGRALRRLNPEHPLAILLEAESRLVQDDPLDARDMLEPLLERYPKMRKAVALKAAAEALLYDDEAMQAAMARYEELSPGSAQHYYEVGRHLSFARQYSAAADMLEKAIERRPNWPAPQIEQGLMELQSGREHLALRILRDVVELDRFNKRAANSLFLLEELADYETVETEHFVIRYKPGIDRVMVAMMPETLEQIYDRVTGRFAHEPERRTTIELMPDHQRFSVRITGMPWIHTIAACTGPVIAMEVPRSGPPSQHRGPFDWPRVVQHEFTHTITLSQTNNRIPHWLTEAAAVSMEDSPRDYDTCLMLAEQFKTGGLFDLDEINWAFIRPRQQGDRAQAYAQGHWMIEFMNERSGESAVIRLLERYFAGEREGEALQNALGISRDAFYEAFLAWAEEEVKRWGLMPEPDLKTLKDHLRAADPKLTEMMQISNQARLDSIVQHITGQVGKPASPRQEPFTGKRWPPLARPPVEVSSEQLDAWLATYPNHPDLLEMKIRRSMPDDGDPSADLIPLLERYAEARPVDPYPHRVLAQHWRKSDTPERAIPHLERLDAHEQKTPVFAVALRDAYREIGQLALASEKAERALQINPYHARNREVAAAIAVQMGDLDTARMHIRALTMIEPDRPQHQQRLDAIEALIEQ